MSSTMQRYKVLAGTHYEKNPDFDKLSEEERKNPFHPKRMKAFVRDEVVLSDRPLDEIYVNHFEKVIEGNNGPVTEERRAAVSALIQTGVWVEDDRPFLENASDDGFERIQKRTALMNNTEIRKKTLSHLGEECTDSFQIAYDHGFKVFRTPSGKYQVTHSQKGDKPLNIKLLDKDAVEKFVESYVSERK
jgi:hypothetical protein